MRAQLGGFVRTYLRQGFDERSARRISGQLRQLLRLLQFREILPPQLHPPSPAKNATIFQISPQLPHPRNPLQPTAWEGDRRVRWEGEKSIGKMRQTDSKEGDVERGKKRRKDKERWRKRKPKDDEQQNQSTPYQTTPQHVWNSVDDFFSSPGLTQLSPWVLQAKPVLGFLALALDLLP